MVIIYGESPLSMDYSVDELNEKIDKYIQDIKNGNGVFSYRNLCYYLFRIAQSENKLKKKADIEYNNPVMSDTDAALVSKLLWQRIWKKEIFIDFHENKYGTNYHNDTRFGVM